MLGLRNFLEGVPLEALGGQTITQPSTFGMGSMDFMVTPVKQSFTFTCRYYLEYCS